MVKDAGILATSSVRYRPCAGRGIFAAMDTTVEVLILYDDPRVQSGLVFGPPSSTMLLRNLSSHLRAFDSSRLRFSDWILLQKPSKLLSVKIRFVYCNFDDSLAY